MGKWAGGTDEDTGGKLESLQQESKWGQRFCLPKWSNEGGAHAFMQYTPVLLVSASFAVNQYLTVVLQQGADGDKD